MALDTHPKGNPHSDVLTKRPGLLPEPGLAASLLVATLVTSLTKQFTVLLFRHALAALLNDGAHLALPLSLGVWNPLVHT